MSTEYEKEYEEASNTMRHYGALPFAELTVFVAITGVLLALLFSMEKPLPYGVQVAVKVGGFFVTVAFWLINISGVYMWTHFARRASILEKSLGYKLYSSLPGAPNFRILRPASIGMWLLYLLIVVFWLLQIFCAGVFQ